MGLRLLKLLDMLGYLRRYTLLRIDHVTWRRRLVSSSLPGRRITPSDVQRVSSRRQMMGVRRSVRGVMVVLHHPGGQEMGCGHVAIGKVL